MTKVFKRVCDQCNGETLHAKPAMGWVNLSLKSLGIIVGESQIKHPVGNYELDFCSAQCFLAHFEIKLSLKKDVKRKIIQQGSHIPTSIAEISENEAAEDEVENLWPDDMAVDEVPF